ncbi:hypothetical protein KKD81_00130 [Patescibacteria group bacterium]|nr:hypothetical protein [Patescibacteria group bacterium]MBU2220326.1 hypothetical protein [Patescibacteria group bacterium]
MADITDPENKSDIIIGMNSELSDVTGIGLPFVKDAIPTRAIQLGSVITFDFDATRRLHMIICHKLGLGGWASAEQNVRFGLDYLNHVNQMEDSDKRRKFSIVNIGTGRVGVRDAADPVGIKRAIADSHLIVDLFVFTPPVMLADVRAARAPLRPVRTWSPNFGEEHLRVSAVA